MSGMFGGYKFCSDMIRCVKCYVEIAKSVAKDQTTLSGMVQSW